MDVFFISSLEVPRRVVISTPTQFPISREVPLGLRGAVGGTQGGGGSPAPFPAFLRLFFRLFHFFWKNRYEVRRVTPFLFDRSPSSARI